MKYRLNNFITEIEIVEKLDNLESVSKVVIVDNLVYKLQKEVLENIIKDLPIYIFDAIEEKKTIDEIRKIYSFFLNNNVNRETIVVGIGGGITTDITAFAASTFKRGCRLQLIPTTFLGMIDAAIGGKTAINFNGIKNAVGTFYPAAKIYVNIEFLKTLSKENNNNGWAECLKVSLIKDTGLYEILSNKNAEITSEILSKSIEIKMNICKNDLTDSGDRRKLNLGHTFAHLIESASEYTISHGEAVAIGIRKAAKYSYNEKMISNDELIKIIELLDKFNLPSSISNKIKSKLKENGKKIILNDKKAGEKVRLVLFQGFQDIIVKEIDNYQKIIDLLIS